VPCLMNTLPEKSTSMRPFSRPRNTSRAGSAPARPRARGRGDGRRAGAAAGRQRVVVDLEPRRLVQGRQGAVPGMSEGLTGRTVFAASNAGAAGVSARGADAMAPGGAVASAPPVPPSGPRRPCRRWTMRCAPACRYW